MINIYRNPSLQELFHVVFDGKLIHKVSSYAHAMEIAQKLSKKYKSPILSSK